MSETGRGVQPPSRFDGYRTRVPRGPNEQHPPHQVTTLESDLLPGILPSSAEPEQPPSRPLGSADEVHERVLLHRS